MLNVYTDTKLEEVYVVQCAFSGKAEAMKAIVESILDGSFNRHAILKLEAEALDVGAAHEGVSIHN